MEGWRKGGGWTHTGVGHIILQVCLCHKEQLPLNGLPYNLVLVVDFYKILNEIEENM